MFSTKATDSPFTLPGGSVPGYDKTFGGSADAFLIKITSNFQSLAYGTFLGGSDFDSAEGLALSGTSAWVCGASGSSDFNFAGGAVVIDNTFGGGAFDGFVAKVDTAAASGGLEYFSFFGGDSADEALDIATDAGGNAWVTGFTFSDGFPIQSALQETRGGSSDAFLCKISPTGSQLLFSTYLGGTESDHGLALALDDTGRAYLTGYTRSSDFPTVNAAQSTFGGGVDPGLGGVPRQDIFVTRLNATADALEYSTFVGGDHDEIPNDIVVSGSVAYVVGNTWGTTFPLVHAEDDTLGGTSDAVFFKMSETGDRIKMSTLIGGSGEERGYGIGLDSAGTVYLSGRTESNDFPTTPGALQTGKSGSNNADIWLRRYWADDLGPVEFTLSSPPEPTSPPYTIESLNPLGGTVRDAGDRAGVTVRVQIQEVAPLEGRFWNGAAWQAPGPGGTGPWLESDVTGIFWDLPYSLIPDSETIRGEYTVRAVAEDVDGNQHAPIEVTFHVSPPPPAIEITAPLHQGWAKAGWSVDGTVVDSSGVGFADNNRVTLSIYREGLYWNGTAWVETPTTLYADILPDNTWSYPGTTPGAQTPTGDGPVAVSAHVRDLNDLSNVVVAGGLPGNNQITFTVDATPPLLELDSPAPATVVTGPPLPADWIKGTAFDSSGPVTVTFKLARTPEFEWEDPLHWNGETWQTGESSSYYFGPIELEGTFPGDNGPTSWKYNGPLPGLGWESSFCLSNGAYAVVAVATDPAGNETEVTRPFSVAYVVEYLPPETDLILIEPGQTPVWGEGDIITNNAATFDPAAGMPGFSWNPLSFVLGNGGEIYTSSQLALPLNQGYRGVVHRQGLTPWRSELELSSVSDSEGTSYFERWFPGDGFSPIPQWIYESGSPIPGAMETDASGNLYVVYHLWGSNGLGSHLRLVKFNAAGSVAWTRTIPEVEIDEAFVGGPELIRLAWLPDGSLGILSKWRTIFQFPSFSDFVTAMVVCETDGDLRYEKVIGIQNSYDIEAPGNFENEPIDFAGDASGNVFLATLETSRGVGFGKWPLPFVRRVLRKLSPTGTVLGQYTAKVADTPERWDSVATDPDGNLYVGGVFLGEVRSPSDPARQFVLKFDSNLNLLWRAYGPGRSLPTVDKVMRMDAGPDGVLTYDNSSMAAFYSAAGQLVWSREILQGDISTTSVVMEDGDVHALIWDWNEQQSSSTYYLAKVSREGDLQMRLLLDSQNYSYHELQVQGNSLYVLRRPLIGTEAVIDRFELPANSGIPVTLDPNEPADQVLIEGDLLELTVHNTGSVATGYQWWKLDPQNGWEEIPGATGRTLRIPSVTLADSAQYECEVTNAVDFDTSRTANVTVLEAVSLELSLDTPGRTWTTGGDAPWVGFGGEPSNDGVDAAMNRPLKRGQVAWVETVVEGPASVSFWWKSSTQHFVDSAEFRVNDEVIALITGDEDWRNFTHDLGEGTHTLRWLYSKASNSNATGDQVWLDEVSIATAVPLGEALDNQSLVWTTGPSGKGWSGTTSPAQDGVDSARSGAIGHEESSYLQTTVTGPGTLMFWWKVSCDPFGDSLDLTVDGAPNGSISGEEDWTRVLRPIAAGTHTVRWTYTKDFFFASGADRGWVDQIRFLVPVNLDLVNGVASHSGSIAPGERQEYRFTFSGNRQVGVKTTGGAALRGELFDGSGNLVASSDLDGDFEFSELLAAGQYFLHVYREPDPGGSAQNFSLEVDTGFSPQPRPDVAVGSSPASLKGRSSYAAPAAQKVSLTSKKGAKVTAYAIVANNGNLAEAMDVSGTGRSRIFGIDYFQGVAKITAAVAVGRYQTAQLAEGGGSTLIKAVVSPVRKKVTRKVGKRTVFLKKTFATTVRAKSSTNPAVSDAAIIEVKTK